MESNKNSFETVKENLCAVLDAVNEENTQMKQQVAILVEENKGLRGEIGNLIEKVDILVSLVEELKNNSNNFIAQESGKIEEYIEEEEVNDEESEEEEASIEEEMVKNEIEEKFADEFEKTTEIVEEYREEEEEEEEEEILSESELEENVARVLEEEDVEPSEFAEEVEVNSGEEEEISFELDLQEMESEELECVHSEEPESVQVATEIEPEAEPIETKESVYGSELEQINTVPKILHEASKPDWYDWEVDYPAPFVEDIQDGIGFNDKMLFIRELFNEDDEKFASTIGVLNGLSTFKGAVEHIRANFQDWDEESDVVYRFYMSIRRKLRK